MRFVVFVMQRPLEVLAMLANSMHFYLKLMQGKQKRKKSESINPQHSTSSYESTLWILSQIETSRVGAFFYLQKREKWNESALWWNIMSATKGASHTQAFSFFLHVAQNLEEKKPTCEIVYETPGDPNI